jgi:hypothetical protein
MSLYYYVPKLQIPLGSEIHFDSDSGYWHDRDCHPIIPPHVPLQYYSSLGEPIPTPAILRDETKHPIPLTHENQLDNFQSFGVIVPIDYVHNQYKTPDGIDVLTRYEPCGYDLPTDTSSTSGADASDGLKIDDLDKKVNLPN